MWTVQKLATLELSCHSGASLGGAKVAAKAVEKNRPDPKTDFKLKYSKALDTLSRNCCHKCDARFQRQFFVPMHIF